MNKKTIGILGLGRVGSIGKSCIRLVAEYARCFDMKVLAYDILDKKTNDFEISHNLQEVLSQVDVVSLHLPFKYLF